HRRFPTDDPPRARRPALDARGIPLHPRHGRLDRLQAGAVRVRARRALCWRDELSVLQDAAARTRRADRLFLAAAAPRELCRYAVHVAGPRVDRLFDRRLAQRPRGRGLDLADRGGPGDGRGAAVRPRRARPVPRPALHPVEEPAALHRRRLRRRAAGQGLARDRRRPGRETLPAEMNSSELRRLRSLRVVALAVLCLTFLVAAMVPVYTDEIGW